MNTLERTQLDFILHKNILQLHLSPVSPLKGAADPPQQGSLHFSLPFVKAENISLNSFYCLYGNSRTHVLQIPLDFGGYADGI